jgi:dihydrofolate reductase
MSLDGYIAETDDTIEWLTGYEGTYEGGEEDPGMAGYDEFYAGIGALVSGSVTYEFVLDHMTAGGQWPYSGKPMWVLSSRDLPVPQGDGADVRIVEAKVEDLHAEVVSAAAGRNVWVIGGGNVASQFAAAGLLDEVIVTVVPVVLGSGKPLFDDAVAGGPMQLTGTTVFSTGMVQLRYRIGDS